jgi:hypothetical protein
MTTMKRMFKGWRGVLVAAAVLVVGLGAMHGAQAEVEVVAPRRAQLVLMNVGADGAAAVAEAGYTGAWTLSRSRSADKAHSTVTLFSVVPHVVVAVE